MLLSLIRFWRVTWCYGGAMSISMYRFTLSSNRSGQYHSRLSLSAASTACVPALAPALAVTPLNTLMPLPSAALHDSANSVCGTSCTPLCYEGEWLPAERGGRREYAPYAHHGQSNAIQHYQQILALGGSCRGCWMPYIDEVV